MNQPEQNLNSSIYALLYVNFTILINVLHSETMTSPCIRWSLDIQYTTPFVPSGKSLALDKILTLFLLNLNSATESHSFFLDSVTCFMREMSFLFLLSVLSVFSFLGLSSFDSSPFPSALVFLLLDFLSDIALFCEKKQ